MRRTVYAAVTALTVLAAVTAGTAGAATPRKVCKLITDPSGDADDLGITTSGGVNDPALDLLGGDIASDAKFVTTVVRVSKLNLAPTTSPLGVVYYFNFSVKGVQFFTQAQHALAGDRASVGYIATLRTSLPDGSATVKFDAAKNEVRVTFKAAQLASQATLKPKDKITALQVLADRQVGTGVKGVPGAVLQADTADGTKAYVAGTPSCVAVGK
jgi:hypothetical protein